MSASIGAINGKRLVTPGSEGWEQSVDPLDPDRYFIATVDSHVGEPVDVYVQGGIDPKYHDRLPKMIIDEEGRQFLSSEGYDRPHLVKGRPKPDEPDAEWERDGVDQSFMMWSDRLEPDDFERMRASGTGAADEPTLSRLHTDMRRDGVDAAVAFCNRGLLAYATPDPDFAHAMCHAWSTWAADTYKLHTDRFIVAAQLATGDVDRATEEVAWIAEQGFRAINIPNQPIWGLGNNEKLNYNHPSFDKLWAAIEATGIPLCMHVGTGKDTRAARGSGGAIINKAVGFLQSALEPLAIFLASGIFERFPKLRFVTVEADIGWIPWLLEALDHAHNKHHMWVRPFMDEMPSTYWYSNCAAAFIEDNVGLALAHEFNLIDNIMWSNDYPHHEGTWPHSKEAIERQLHRFTHEERAKLLGLNAARVFGFDPVALRAAEPTGGVLAPASD